MNKNYLMLDGQKIPFTAEQVEKIKDICGVGRVKLSDIAEGESFRIADVEFIKFPEINGRVPVAAKELLTSMKFGENNNLKESVELKAVLTEFIEKIVAAVGAENVLNFETDLLALDGTDDYGSMGSKVSLPTLDFYRANKKIFDKHNPNKWWWLATPDSTSNKLVLCVAPSGGIRCNGFYNFNGGVRPFCILKSDIFVSK